MPYTTAHRCVVVNKHFTKATATKLGIRKAQLLHRYVEMSKLRKSAEKIAKADARLGTPRRAVSALSTRDLEVLISQLRMQTGKAKIPKPTVKMRRAVAEMKAGFIEEFGVVPKVRIDMKGGVVDLEIPLSEAGGLMDVDD